MLVLLFPFYDKEKRNLLWLDETSNRGLTSDHTYSRVCQWRSQTDVEGMSAQFPSAFVNIPRQRMALFSVDCLRYDTDLVKSCDDSTESTRNQAMLDDFLGSHFSAALT